MPPLRDRALIVAPTSARAVRIADPAKRGGCRVRSSADRWAMQRNRIEFMIDVRDRAILVARGQGRSISLSRPARCGTPFYRGT
jgi:hypothetical protein